MGWSTDFEDMTHDFGFGGIFGGGASLRERVMKRLSQYDRTFMIDPTKNAKYLARLNYFASKIERRLAKLKAAGKEDSRRSNSLEDLLNQIYKRTRSSTDLGLNGKGQIKSGAARDNAEGRAATIYLGGFSARLGVNTASPQIPAGGGTPNPPVRNPGHGPARSFLGQYYGGGLIKGDRRNRGQLP